MPRDPVEEATVIHLDDLSPVPKYQQIVERVRALAADGTLAPGARLPSVRQLAGDLGINVNTVLAAYRALEADGIVVTRHGARAMIHPRLARPSAPQPADVARVRALLERVRTEALLAGVRFEALRALALEVFGDPPTSARSGGEHADT
jgi:DNA-binding transcriptional regulator YhcF (GntR family)